MLKSLLKTSVCIACLAWSGMSCAAGLGGINVTSALGQPLKAEVEVTAVDKAEKSSLRAQLASVDAYKNAGIDYPYGIPKLKFQLEDRENGESFINITSAQPVNAPFLTLLVELSWSSGKLMREYTFLLDPVDYKPEQPKAEELKPIEPVLAEPTVAPEVAAASAPAVTETVAQPSEIEAASAVEPVAESQVAATPETEAVPAEQAMTEQALTQASAPAAAPAEAVPATQEAQGKEVAGVAPAPEHIVVQRGDTLTKIAAQIKPADVSLERMLVALYRENAGVFDGHNMNRVRAGRILTIPQREAMQMLPQADAVEEIHAQAADWNAYRRKLAAVQPAAAPAKTAEKQEVSGKISAAVIDKAFPAKEPAKEVLKLSKGEAPTGEAVGGGKTSAQEKAIAKEEEAIAKGKALKESEERTAILEKNVQDMKRLAELKKESAPVVSAPASAPVSAAVAGAASAPQPAAPAKPKVKIAPPKVVEQPSMLDQLLGEPLYLAGGGALLLALGGLGFMVARRAKQGGGKKKIEDIGSATGHLAAPVASSPETGDFTHAAVQAAHAAAGGAEAEDVDPIGEADLFLTFGRDAQAEEVLKEALKKNPNNTPVKLKLLSIYSNRKDTNSFYSYAREIKESGDKSAWEQAVAMGRVLDPSNPFYGGDASAASTTQSRAGAASPAVDFDLGFGAPASAAPEFGSQNTVVMEAPSHESTAIMSAEELRAAVQPSSPMDFDVSAAQGKPMDFDLSGTNVAQMDFDITGTNPGLPSMSSTGGPHEATAVVNMDDLVFDVTTTHESLPVSAHTAEAAAGSGGMEFMLDFPIESKPATPVQAPSLGLGDLSLDFDKLGSSAAAAEPKDAQWQEVATKLDLAKAYQEMGDVGGAREILDEVLRDGDDQQRATAQALMQQL